MLLRKAQGRRVISKRVLDPGANLLALGRERGCYVFTIRAGRGATPIYVGKATKSFKQECLNPSNRHKFSNGMADYKRGTPVLYFGDTRRKKGKLTPNKSAKSRIF